MTVSLNGLVDTLYDATRNPALWQDALKKVCVALGSVDSTITIVGKPLSMVGTAEQSDALNDYTTHWWQHDIIRLAVPSTVTKNQTYCDWQLIDSATRASSPFYQEFRRQNGVCHLIGSVNRVSPIETMRFAIQLPIDLRNPRKSLVKKFELVASHVGRAYELASLRHPQADITKALLDVLQGNRRGVAIVDRNGKIIFANEALEKLSADGLRIVQGALRSDHPKIQDAIEHLIGSVIDGAERQGGSQFALVSRPSRPRPLLARAIALPLSYWEMAASSDLKNCHALLTIFDLGSDEVPGLEDTLRVLGLTPSEARVAALVGIGISPATAAVRLGLTEGTVRTRVKQIFEKLKISRQSELANLVTQVTFIS